MTTEKKTPQDIDQDAQNAAEGRKTHEKNKSEDQGSSTPPAGPHADPKLIDDSKTPGSGATPSDSDDVDPGSG